MTRFGRRHAIVPEAVGLINRSTTKDVGQPSSSAGFAVCFGPDDFRACDSPWTFE